MLKKEILTALNNQIQQELTASYGYMALSIFFEQQLLKGFAAYFEKQMKEEQEHAHRLLEYVQDRSGDVTLGTIEPPKTKINTVLDAMRFAREAELKNSESIHALYNLAAKEGDLATKNALEWFINEQVEEEKWTEEFVVMAEKFANHPGALFMWDHRVSKLAKKDDDED